MIITFTCSVVFIVINQADERVSIFSRLRIFPTGIICSSTLDEQLEDGAGDSLAGDLRPRLHLLLLRLRADGLSHLSDNEWALDL